MRPAQNGSTPLVLTDGAIRELLDTTPHALVIVNHCGRITLVNSQTEVLFGYRRDELVGQPVEMLLPVRFRDAHVRKRDGYMARPKLRPMGAGLELTAARNDGTELQVEVSLSPLTLDTGLVVSAAIIDLTERKRAEEERRQLESQLLQAQKMESLGILTGGIAHDFNNLLTVILGNTSLARRQMPPESPAQFAIREIETAALRSADLVRQMLAYAGKGRFLMQPLNLCRVIEEIAHLLQTVITKKAVLRLEFAPQMPTVNADATQVRQVVMNLMTNASDAIVGPSGEIVVRTGVMFADRKYLSGTHIPVDLPEGQYAYIEVADTGCGMDAPTLEKIFDPFFTTKFTGRGLGLAAVLGIVRGHKGVVKISSEVNRGTTFKVLLPCSGPPTESSASAVTVEPDWRGKGTILVVDDEEHVRGTVMRILEHHGLSVLPAADGREALAAFLRNPDAIQLVLTDLTMPRMDGAELFRELRLVRPDVRVVLMSGYTEQEVSHLFAGRGLGGFVHKPFRMSELVSVVRRALEE